MVNGSCFSAWGKSEDQEQKQHQGFHQIRSILPPSAQCTGGSVAGRSVNILDSTLDRRTQREILDMATQAETTCNMFHALDRDLALQLEEGLRRAESPPRKNNHALQAFARLKCFSRDAIESLAAEIFRGALD
jgi:hypothetical protein